MRIRRGLPLAVAAITATGGVPWVPRQMPIEEPQFKTPADLEALERARQKRLRKAARKGNKQ